MDDDLAGMSREQLLEEIRRLRQGIRAHRDSTGQDLCWHHPELWGLLPEKQDPLPTVPEWPEFMRGCVRYRQSLDEQAQHAPGSVDELDWKAKKSQPSTADVEGLRRLVMELMARASKTP